VTQTDGEENVKNKNLEKMSVDELWKLHEEIHNILSTKLDAEKRQLERRLVNSRGPLGTNQRRVDPTRQFILNTAIRRGLLRPGLDEGSDRAG
jgi:hypothetical protein